jgi:hypothetical protein
MKSRFIEHTTITGRKIWVRSNQNKRHFTIKTESGKYRTIPMSQDEFNSCENNTGNDWEYFLRSEDYYKLK